MDTQIRHHLPTVLGEGLGKGTVASASICVWEKAAPPGFAMMSDDSVPTPMSLVPFELLL